MTKRILRSILVVSFLLLVASTGLTMGVLYHHFGNQLEKELRTEAEYLAVAIEGQGESAFEKLPADISRVTYIDTDGTVLFDSKADAAKMENHKDREEIQEAMKNGRGTAVRNSDTLSKKTLYYALKLDDGKIIRVSSVQYNIPGLIGGMVQPMLLIILVVLAFSVWLAVRVSRKIVEPINNLDLNNPEENKIYDEIAPLLIKINRQQKALQREIAEAKRQQEEFSIITDNMEEGVIVIDSHTEVLSYNRGALRLLGAEASVERQSVLAMNRSPRFQNIVEQVLSGRHMSCILEFEGRFCQAAANPVMEKDVVTGAVLLLLDVTERMKGEQMRREFTANVSHELKTPLTSISGFAEIIGDGFVKPEDIKKFAQRIFKESQRLITLVNDIIKISQLDEGKVFYNKEELDLYQEAKETLKLLEEKAKDKGIKLYLYGPHVQIRTVKTILEEILLNLCDNGIKYNKIGGSLTVTIAQEKNRPQIIVEDTGIGIPNEDQQRIFERFYRVDKSHSKAIGGTGLGLSIVKHGSMFLGAEVKVESNLGEGSRFILTFPEEV